MLCEKKDAQGMSAGFCPRLLLETDESMKASQATLLQETRRQGRDWETAFRRLRPGGCVRKGESGREPFGKAPGAG